ncbi:hypothetical protein PIB30_058489 [Stylosanthes scabra]|uniref:Uncharacterized protein n=1 Tax=Stylosanthes scabra TaxID=79078 RepID=A0ABU6SK30_9FABA|nr:hypothetical protein [Stylosanthes scabra]
MFQRGSARSVARVKNLIPAVAPVYQLKYWRVPHISRLAWTVTITSGDLLRRHPSYHVCGPSGHHTLSPLGVLNMNLLKHTTGTADRHVCTSPCERIQSGMKASSQLYRTEFSETVHIEMR